MLAILKFVYDIESWYAQTALGRDVAIERTNSFQSNQNTINQN